MRHTLVIAAVALAATAVWLQWPIASAPPCAFAEAEGLLRAWTDAAWSSAPDDVADTRPPWVRRYWRIRNERAGLPSAPAHDLTRGAS